MKRMILFGGSFNPVHFGHIWMAQAALENLGAKQVVFMPTGDSPHKEVTLPAGHRGEMVRRVCEENPGFVYSDFEIRRSEPSYTIRTVEHILSEEPDQKIWLLMGEDSFLQFHLWKEYEKLLQKVILAVIPRHHDLPLAIEEQEEKLRGLGGKIHWIPMPRIELSSTAIRRRRLYGRTIKNTVPDSVAAYIQEQGLYRDPQMTDALSRLQEQLGTWRYEHSLRVAETAEHLARLHGVDTTRARWAGLLHDAAKGHEDTLLRDKEIRSSFSHFEEPESLWHTYLGPEMAKRTYGITDPEILRAIRLHTTGGADMTPLDKIVFIADKTEPGRRDPINRRLLLLAEKDLEEGFYRVLQASLAYLEQKQLTMHPDTRELYQSLKKERQFDRKNGTDSKDPGR